MNANVARKNYGNWLINHAIQVQFLSNKMKAIKFDGPATANQAQVLDIPTPVPGNDEILIKTAAYAFINANDDYAGISGTIEGTGANVAGFTSGSKIYGITAGGGCAQYTVLKAAQAVLMPVNLLFPQAAALAVPLMVAHIVLSQIGRLRWEQRLLMRNCTGDVSQVILQVAKTVGAHVTVTDTRQDKEFLKSLGADNFFEDSDDKAIESLADMVLQFMPNGALADVRFPKHQVSLPAAAAITWQQGNQQRLQFGKMLVEDGTVKAQATRQISWKSVGLNAALTKQQPGQLVLLMD